MPCFTYAAVDAVTGQTRRGTIDGETVAAAAAALKARGWLPTEVVRVAPASGGGGRWRGWAGRGRWSARERTLFTRQLSSLVRAGLPLLRALEVLSRQQVSPPVRALAARLAEAIRAGGTLSGAFAREAGKVDRLYVALVRAGEAAGALPEVLERLAQFLEKAEQTRRKVRAALAYPLFVAVVAAGIVGALTVFVIPRFREVFDGVLKGQSLPRLTEAVLGAAELLQQQAGWLAGAAGLAAVGWGAALRSARLARWRDRACLAIPLVARLEQQASSGRFTRTLGTLIGAGVPLLEALAIAGAAVRNRVVAGAIEDVRGRVRAGEALSAAMEGTGRFAPMVTSLVQVGEETGRPAEVLQRAADLCDEEVDQTVSTVTALLEPAMIVVMALVVGIVVIALFLPILRIVQSLS